MVDVEGLVQVALHVEGRDSLFPLLVPSQMMVDVLYPDLVKLLNDKGVCLSGTLIVLVEDDVAVQISDDYDFVGQVRLRSTDEVAELLDIRIARPCTDKCE